MLFFVEELAVMPLDVLPIPRRDSILSLARVSCISKPEDEKYYQGGNDKTAPAIEPWKGEEGARRFGKESYLKYIGIAAGNALEPHLNGRSLPPLCCCT